MIKIKNFAVKQCLSERFEQYNNFWISCILNVHLTCNRSHSGHPQGIGDDGQTHTCTNRHRFAKMLLIKPTHTFANQWMLSSRASSPAVWLQQGSRGEVRLIYSFSKISCADGRLIWYQYENPIGGRGPGCSHEQGRTLIWSAHGSYLPQTSFCSADREME